MYDDNKNEPKDVYEHNVVNHSTKNKTMQSIEIQEANLKNLFNQEQLNKDELCECLTYYYCQNINRGEIPHKSVLLKIRHRIYGMLKAIKLPPEEALPAMLEYVKGICIVNNNLCMAVDTQVHMLTQFFGYKIKIKKDYDKEIKESFVKISISHKSDNEPIYEGTTYFSEMKYLRLLKLGKVMQKEEEVKDLNCQIDSLRKFMDIAMASLELVTNEEDKQRKLGILNNHLVSYDILIKQKSLTYKLLNDEILRSTPYATAEQHMIVKRVLGCAIRSNCPEMNGIYEPEEMKNQPMGVED